MCMSQISHNAALLYEATTCSLMLILFPKYKACTLHWWQQWDCDSSANPDTATLLSER